MIINKNEVDIDRAMKIADIDNVILKRRDGKLLLSDWQVSVLNRCSIKYNNFLNMKDLLFVIEDYLNNLYDEELDIVGSQISEFIYYNNINK